MENPLLIVQTAFVGDLLLSIPLIRRLRKNHPSAPIWLLCRKGLGDFFLKTQLVEKVVEIDKNDSSSSWPAAEVELSRQEFMAIYCPHRSFRSARLVHKLKAAKKVGYWFWWNGWAFGVRHRRPEHLPEVFRQLCLLIDSDAEIASSLRDYSENQKWRSGRSSSISLMEGGFVLPEWASMRLPVVGRDQLASRFKTDMAFYQAMEKVFELSKQYKLFDKEVVFFAPGSVWNTKRWTLKGYQELGKNLKRRGFNLAIIGAPDESPIAEQVCAEISGAVNLCGKTTLFETYQLLLKAKALVCNDSGAMHLGAVANVPSVAVFGPTTLDLGYRPWQENAVVVQKDLKCRPCGKHGAERCPIATHECMEAVNDLQVLEAFDSLFKK